MATSLTPVPSDPSEKRFSRLGFGWLIIAMCFLVQGALTILGCLTPFFDSEVLGFLSVTLPIVFCCFFSIPLGLANFSSPSRLFWFWVIPLLIAIGTVWVAQLFFESWLVYFDFVYLTKTWLPTMLISTVGLFWIIRMMRGWVLLPVGDGDPNDFDRNTPVAKAWREAAGLIAGLGMAYWLWVLLRHKDNGITPGQWAITLIPGLIISLIWFPLSTWVLRTNRPVFAITGSAVTVAVVAIVIFFLINLPNAQLTRFWVSPTARAAFINTGIGASILLFYLAGIRMAGYQLIKPTYWTKPVKKADNTLVPHPLDD